ncbi:hypothetical protein HC031_14280 [Planosporangium thailandense]|uniref:Cytochrome b561 domain-containing protein n=1 Tax=Planosporangium thailandense TaxID=765197 RepID=A0ABX0XXW4_9ACTN|nr:hypothetical protein [Planosporangium thailandense]NJC70873.1 hypothetical protein [Planosporangium thailandense]
MPIAGGPSDRTRMLRRWVARGVILVYFFLLVSVGLIVTGKERYFLTHGTLGVVIAVAFVPLTAGFVAAAKVLGAGDRGRSGHLTVSATALLLLGVLIIAADVVMGG